MKTPKEILEECLSYYNVEGLVQEGSRLWMAIIDAMRTFAKDEPEQKPDLPESKGSETDMGTKIEPEFPSWTETESGVTEKSNPQYGIYHFLKHWYYRVVAPCLKSDGWIPVSERLPKEKEVGKKVLVWRRLNESQSSLNPSIYNTNMVKHCDTDALWQPLPAVPQGERRQMMNLKIERNSKGEALFNTFWQRIKFVCAIVFLIPLVFVVTFGFGWLMYWLITGDNVYRRIFEGKK